MLVTVPRTARRTDSASASGSRRRARGRLSTVDTTTSNTISSSASPAAILLGDADQINLGIVGQFALFGHRDGDEGAAGKSHPPPFDHGARLGVLQDVAVLVEPPRGQFVDDAGIAGPELDQIAIAAGQHLRDASGARQLRMFRQMQRLAVNRDQELRPHP